MSIRNRRTRMVVVAACALGLGPVAAHEGHKALEVKGIRVEADAVTLCPAAQKSLGMEMGDVGTASLEDRVTAPATVGLPNEARTFASSRVSGRVLAVHARPGDVVREGDVLAEVESPDLAALVLDLAPVRTRIAQAQRALDRARKAAESGTAPGKELLPLEAELREAQAEESALLARVEAVVEGAVPRSEIERSTPPNSVPVRAPRGGIVVHADVTAGEFVAPDRHLFEIHDLGHVYLVGQVFEGDISRVAKGQEVRMRVPSYPDRVFAGAVLRTGYEVDRTTRRLDVYAEVENPDLVLKPGVVGQMEIVVDRAEDAIVIPSAAVAQLGAETFAFVYDAERSAKATADERDRRATMTAGAPSARAADQGGGARKPFCSEALAPGEELSVLLRKDLVLGRERGGLIEILDGVFPGDRVLVRGQHELATFFAQGKLRLSEAAVKNLGIQRTGAIRRALDEVVRLPAEIVEIPDRRAEVSTLVDGKVRRFLVTVGQAVRKDDPLVEIESLEIQAVFLDLLTEHVRLAAARTNLDRVRTVVASGGAPGKDVIAAEAAAEQLEVAAQRLRKRLVSLGAEDGPIEEALRQGKLLTTLTLRSPMAGTVATLPAAVGQVVTPSDHVASIVDLGEIYVRGTADSRDIGVVTPGRKARARLVAFPGQVHEVELRATTQMFDPDAKVLSFYATLPNPDGRLIPGMTGDLFVIIGSRPEAVAIPREAVLRDGAGPAVVVADKDTYRLVPVRFGAGDDRSVEVVQGVTEGDEVVTTGKERIRTGLVTVR